MLFNIDPNATTQLRAVRFGYATVRLKLGKGQRRNRRTRATWKAREAQATKESKRLVRLMREKYGIVGRGDRAVIVETGSAVTRESEHGHE